MKTQYVYQPFNVIDDLTQLQLIPDVRVDLRKDSMTYGYLFRYIDGEWRPTEKLDELGLMQAIDQSEDGMVVIGGLK